METNKTIDMQNNTPCLRDLIRARHLCEKNLSEALAAYIERPENERLAIAVNIAREELRAAKIKEDEYVEALFRYKDIG